MKLLIFSAYYEPEVAASLYLSSNLYEELVNAGWDIDLFVPMPTRGIDKATRNLYKGKKIEKKYNNKLTVHRFSMIKEGKNPLIRAIRYFIVNIAFIIKGLQHQGDLIFVQSTPPTQGAMGVILKKMKKIPLVYGLQDVFPDSLVSTGITKKGSWIWKVGRLIENFTYKNADRIVVISEDFKKNLLNKSVSEKKIEVIYNWVDEKEIVPIPKESNKLYEKFNLNPNLFYVVYAGNLGTAQNVDVIIETAKLLKEEKNIAFLIFGSGVKEKEYQEIVKKINLTNLELLPIQPYNMVSEVYSLGDLSVVSCKAGFGKSAMPSKTWSIMSAGTAVLASFDENTDLQNIIEKNNVGLFVKANDAEGLKKAILKLYKNKGLCKEMGLNGRSYILENLTKSIGTKKYIDIFESEGEEKSNV